MGKKKVSPDRVLRYGCETKPGASAGGCGGGAHVIGVLERRLAKVEAKVEKQAQEKGPSKKELAARASRQRQLDAQAARFDRNSAAIRKDLDMEMARRQGKPTISDADRLHAFRHKTMQELAAGGHLSKAEKAAYNATLPKNSRIRLK